MPLGFGTIQSPILLALNLAQPFLLLQQIKFGLRLKALTSSEETKYKVQSRVKINLVSKFSIIFDYYLILKWNIAKKTSELSKLCVKHLIIS